MKTSHRSSRTLRTASIGAAALLNAAGAFAVNGTSLSGIGVKSAGMGGTSIAFPQDAAAAGNNPAGMGVIGSRADLGIQVLRPSIDYQYGAASNDLHSGGLAPVPEGGANWQLDSRTTLGVSVFGVGVGTNYGRPALLITGAESAKSSLQAIVAAPTLTYKLDEKNIVGVSVALAYERFMAQGVIKPSDDGPHPIRSHGTSTAFGHGLRLGYLWLPTPELTLGALYASRIRMGRLSGYQNDLLAVSGGRIDVAPRYGLGLSYKASPALTVAADFLHIAWSKTILGSAQGFAWRDQNVFRLGAAYDINSKWTIRVGYTRANASFESAAVAQNFLSPLPNAKAVTAGFTYRIDAVDEISALYEYGFSHQVVGSGHSVGFKNSSRTQLFGLSFGHKF